MLTSYNGWPASSDPADLGILASFEAGGVQFPGGVKAGDVAAVLGYVAAQWHELVEPLIDGWCWGYNYRANVNNPSTLSCHSSGTAIDINAPAHPNGGPQYGGLDEDQVAAVRRILAEVAPAVDWGADFNGTKDPMHMEISCDADTLAGVAAQLAGDDVTPDEVRTVVDAALDNFFRTERLIVTNDRAATPNDVTYSYETALERLIRLTSGTFVGESGAPHND